MASHISLEQPRGLFSQVTFPRANQPLPAFKGRHFNGNPKASNGRESGRNGDGSGSAAMDKGRASIQKNADDDTTA
jgi:hypothetical protein